MKLKTRIFSGLLALILCISLAAVIPTAYADAAAAPTKLWVAPTEANGIPVQIDVFGKRVQTGGTTWNPTYSYEYQLCLPGNVDLANCFLS